MRVISLQLVLLAILVVHIQSYLHVKSRFKTWKLSLSKALSVMDFLPPDDYHNPPESNNNLELLDEKTLPQVLSFTCIHIRLFIYLHVNSLSWFAWRALKRTG